MSYLPRNTIKKIAFPVSILFISFFYIIESSAMEKKAPLNPEITGHLEGKYKIVGFDKGYLFTSEDSNLKIWCIKPQGPPSIICEVSLSGECNSLGFDGQFAYAANGKQGIQVINLENIEKPEVIGKCNIGDFASKVHLRGALAFVESQNDSEFGFSVLDVSDPKQPQLIGKFAMASPSPATGSIEMSVYDSLVLIAVWDHFYLIDIRNPKSPKLIHSCTPLNEKIDPDTDFKFGNPLLIGKKVIISYFIYDINYRGQESDGLLQLELDDGLHVTKASKLDFSFKSRPFGLRFSGETLIVAQSGSLSAYDVSRSGLPQLKSKASFPSDPFLDNPDRITVKDDYAFIASGEAGLSVIRISEAGGLHAVTNIPPRKIKAITEKAWISDLYIVIEENDIPDYWLTVVKR